MLCLLYCFGRGGGGGTQCVHGHSCMTTDSRIPAWGMAEGVVGRGAFVLLMKKTTKRC